MRVFWVELSFHVPWASAFGCRVLDRARTLLNIPDGFQVEAMAVLGKPRLRYNRSVGCIRTL